MDQAQFNPLEDVCGRLQFIIQLFTTDVNAMSNEALSDSCGGVSRCGHDMIFEITGMLHHFTGLLASGSGSITGPAGGFPVAPDSAKDNAAALAGLGAANEGFLQALKSNTALFDQLFDSPIGKMSPLSLGNLVILNVTYHSGQLNYIQTIQGDGEFHWF